MNNQRTKLVEKKCSVHGCKGHAGHYGLCRLHYMRAWRAMRSNQQLGRLPYLAPEILNVISQSKPKSKHRNPSKTQSNLSNNRSNNYGY